MQLPIRASDFLERSEGLSKNQDAASLLYAAFELRCGIEARLIEYAAYVVGISQRQEREWEIKRISRTIDAGFQLGDTMLIILVQLRDGGTAQFIYAPVTKRLQEIGKQCGDYLHARRLVGNPESQRWPELRALLNEGCGLLRLACSGEVMRPNIDQGWHFALEPDDPRVEAVYALQNGTHAGVQLLNIVLAGPITYYPAGKA